MLFHFTRWAFSLYFYYNSFSIEKIPEKEPIQFLKQAKSRCNENDVSFIQKNKFDLIIVGSRDRISMREIFLGSVLNYVLHKTCTPVLVVE